jgi:hypothetical protein
VSLHEAIRGAARRANSSPWPFQYGEITAYDPATSFVKAQYDVVDSDGSVFQMEMVQMRTAACRRYDPASLQRNH